MFTLAFLQHSSFLSQSKRFYSTTVEQKYHSNSTEPRRRARFICRRNNGSRRDMKRRGDGRRPNRVGELIRREISPIIDDAYSRVFRRGNNSNQVMVSVVNVECTEDLRNARVKISVFGDDTERKEAFSWLRSARKEIRYELAQCVQLKYIPELSFEESEMAKAVNTLNIINELERQRLKKSSMEMEGVGVTRLVDDMTEADKALEDALRLDGLDSLDDDEDDDDLFIIDVDDEDEEEMANEKDRNMDILGKAV